MQRVKCRDLLHLPSLLRLLQGSCKSMELWRYLYVRSLEVLVLKMQKCIGKGGHASVMPFLVDFSFNAYMRTYRFKRSSVLWKCLNIYCFFFNFVNGHSRSQIKFRSLGCFNFVPPHASGTAGHVFYLPFILR